MPSIVKSPTDRFICEMVTIFYEEGYDYQPYLCMSVDQWVRGRIEDTKLSRKDKERAFLLVQD